MPKQMIPLGVDIGGSGIKGAPVDLEKGSFADDRVRIPTPDRSTPEAVCAVVEEVIGSFADIKKDAPVGITVPGVVVGGVVRSAANIHKSWIGCHAEELFSDALGRPVHVVNDADAAGVAEHHYGAARGVDGLVLLTTLGTGIGTALIHDGVLVPNSELGHLEIEGHDAETQAAQSAMERDSLDWAAWAERLQTYYSRVEALLWPELFVVGGGISKQADQFLPLLDLRTPIVPAKLRNKAGIIGAAFLADQHAKGSKG